MFNYRHSRLVVKVSNCGLPCHEFEPSTTKDPPCREAMQLLWMSLRSAAIVPIKAVPIEMREMFLMGLATCNCDDPGHRDLLNGKGEKKGGGTQGRKGIKMRN
ncbi:hypothetical protein TNCV_2167911 [Trichonephila clavipes]|nr:hypothetical protein TNCV_2167911 [Trichonephila clavipes]